MRHSSQKVPRVGPLRVMHDCYTDAGCEGRHEEPMEMRKAIVFFSLWSSLSWQDHRVVHAARLGGP